jgi:excisionase family DNA binding protein
MMQDQDQDRDKLLTPQQVADRLQVEIRTIRRYIKQGKLSVIRLDRAQRIRQSELERFLRERETA